MSPNPALANRLAVDARSLEDLRQLSKSRSEASVRGAARQFEALFLGMLMKSMRDALPGHDMFTSNASRLATGMLDEQWTQTLSGRGVGLADMMTKQLSRSQARLDYASHKTNRDSLHGSSGITTQGAADAAGGTNADNEQITQPSLARSHGKSATVTGTPGLGNATGIARDFVRRMQAHANEAERSSGIPAHFVLGQAALESGWGRREILSADGTTTHNLFGIKAGRNWQGATVDVVTTEYVNGVPRKGVEKFRAYESYSEAFNDYVNLLTRNTRYAAAKAERDDAAVFAQRIQTAGYATDPAYARKLTQVINQTLAFRGAA